MNKITIELCAEDRARLDRIIEALEKKAAAGIWPENLGSEAIPEPTPAEAEPAKIDPPVAPAPAEVKTEPQTAITQADIQRRVVELSAAGNKQKAAVRLIVKRYADRVSQIPAEAYAEVMEQLDQVEA